MVQDATPISQPLKPANRVAMTTLSMIACLNWLPSTKSILLCMVMAMKRDSLVTMRPLICTLSLLSPETEVQV
jgi:hypothetical protein